MKNGIRDAAFPQVGTPTCDGVLVGGLTKRELIAAMCLQGLLSTLPTLRSADKNYVAHTALEYTDALLRELSSNKESGE